MRVLHLSMIDGVASYRLHTGLRRLGIDSTMLVGERLRDDPTITAFQPSRNPLLRLRRRVRGMLLDRDLARYRHQRIFELFTDDRTELGTEILAQLPPCDLIQVHTLLGIADHYGFYATVPRQVPVVRTLHDMNFFTGGCHQDAWCGKYTARCGACPQLGSQAEGDLSRQIWNRKRAAFRAIPPGRLHLVAVSRWIANEARRSTLLRDFPVTLIPLGVDTDVFSPRDRRAARSVLNLPLDAFVALFVADPITRVNKGFAHLAQALDGLPAPRDLLLLSVGSGRPPADVRVPHQHLGHVDNERLLAVVYNAADIFVIPSQQDNSPQTALEALACGVPVVGYATCGIPEIVRPGLTGLLVPPQDVAALGAAIETLRRDPARRAELSAQCRQVAVEEYSLALQATRYVELYQGILNESVQAAPPDSIPAPVA